VGALRRWRRGSKLVLAACSVHVCLACCDRCLFGDALDECMPTVTPTAPAQAPMSTLEPKHAPHDGNKPDTKIDGSCTSSVRVGACVVCACMHVSARRCTVTLLVSPADRVVEAGRALRRAFGATWSDVLKNGRVDHMKR
jgi:hypothetical protein